MRLRIGLVASVLPGLLLLASTVFAKPAFVKQYAAYYKGSTPTCTTCHSTPPRLNPYGVGLQKALKGGKVLTPAIFKASSAKEPKS